MLDKAELLGAITGSSDASSMDSEARVARLKEMARELGERAKAAQGG